MSFIPMIGVLFGLIALIWGLVTKRSGGKKLALIGTAGICFTVILYSALFYFAFVQRGGVYDNLRTRAAQNNLNSLVPVIEFYKISHGEYPETLEVLKASLPKGSPNSLYVMDPRIFDGRMKNSEDFYYRKVDSDHYYLRAVAPDGKPFSAGALVPESGGKSGLLTDTPKDQP
jgi:hypothetical protein